MAATYNYSRSNRKTKFKTQYYNDYEYAPGTFTDAQVNADSLAVKCIWDSAGNDIDHAPEKNVYIHTSENVNKKLDFGPIEL